MRIIAHINNLFIRKFPPRCHYTEGYIAWLSKLNPSKLIRNNEVYILKSQCLQFVSLSFRTSVCDDSYLNPLLVQCLNHICYAWI